jgi:glutamine amidotransferase
MKALTVGIVDYGVGNLGSVNRTLLNMGYRCRISCEPDVLGQTDIILLPGVGAFPAAMHALYENDLIDFLQLQAQLGRPIIGICLGMQLLADFSHEFIVTPGLGLIPGNVVTLPNSSWHIGWNTLEVLNDEKLLNKSNGRSFYFNHSFVFETPREYQIGIASLSKPLTVAVRRGNVVGVQFHPEKSQFAGKALLKSLIDGLCCA